MWDLDGVACEWVGPFYKWLCEIEDFEPTPWITWHHYRNHGMTDQEFVVRLTQYAEDGGFGDQVPSPGFQDAVKQIAAAGHIQCVVTDRPAPAHADTAWWVDTFAPEIDSVEFDKDKTIFKHNGPPTYYGIDDRVENVEAMRKAGIYAYLLTRPWNEESDLPRVASLAEFVQVVTRTEVMDTIFE